MTVRFNVYTYLNLIVNVYEKQFYIKIFSNLCKSGTFMNELINIKIG